VDNITTSYTEPNRQPKKISLPLRWSKRDHSSKNLFVSQVLFHEIGHISISRWSQNTG